MPSKNFIFDANGADKNHGAFVVTDHAWNEEAHADGRDVLAWGPNRIWDGPLYCASTARLQQIQQMHPGFLNYMAVLSVHACAQAKDYTGPDNLAALAQWAGVDGDLSTPLGRCRIMAAIMRSERMR